LIGPPFADRPRGKNQTKRNILILQVGGIDSKIALQKLVKHIAVNTNKDPENQKRFHRR